MGLGFIIRWVIIPWYSMLGYAILTLCFITLAEALTLGIGDVQGGGFCGAWLYATFHYYFNPIGSAFIWLFCLMVGMELCFHISWVNLFSRFLGFLAQRKEEKKNFKSLIKEYDEKEDEEEDLDEEPKKKPSFSITFKNPFKKEKKEETERQEIPEPLPVLDIQTDGDGGRDGEEENSDLTPADLNENDPLGLKSRPLISYLEEKNETSVQEQPQEREEQNEEQTAQQADKEEEKRPAKQKAKKKGLLSIFTHTQEPAREEEEEKTPVLPSVELLSPIAEEKDAPTKASLEEKGNSIIRCLADFNVQGKLAGILPGPVVTMYEIRPERGVKVARFEALSKDIAMAIKAVAVRIQAPIPGTDTVGVEAPNEKRQLVCFREILQHPSFVNSESKLTLGLGKDIFGNPVSVKMDDMPHLLVAGATGAGKSVCLNSIILSILFKAQPSEVQMLLIDPKRVELSMYNGLPHLVHPVVTDMNLARNALLWAVDEMEQRYKLFENLGLRNITEYNTLVRKAEERGISENLAERLQALELERLEKLPFIVIIVDELADLMMQKGKEVEGQIARLGQLARAAGMHIILATQRPSVDVITGLIKNNFPTRIAFQVSGQNDSRTILDSAGAEALLGKGDMLYKPRSGRTQRIHGAFVTEDEVRAVTDFWKKQAQPQYRVDFSQYGESAPEPVFSEGGSSEQDEKYPVIVEWLGEQDSVSISMLQRRFGLGFSRAGRIIDQLEADGYIEARSGSKPRKVIH